MVGTPIVYVRGYAGPTSGIDEQVDDPFYGFNKGATHVRVGGDGDPVFYQYEGPLLRLMVDHDYQLLVHGDQRRLLDDGSQQLPARSLWIHRFYDPAATSFAPPAKENLLQRTEHWLHRHVSADGFNIELAAADLYDLITQVRSRTGADKVHVVAHSMGGLIARCMLEKICEQPRQHDGEEQPRLHGRDIVDRLFTFGTPHGGIATRFAVADVLMEGLGPAGSDIFAPDKMYGYLTPGKTFGVDVAPPGWDPQVVHPGPGDADDGPPVFPLERIFCLVGTDPVDYGAARWAIGPRSDGLVRIEHAYVRGAHRAYVYKSHSGSYGEVNSEEGYQNLRRFLFGRWEVALTLTGLSAEALADPQVSWQADMRLAVRGLPVIMSEQQAAHWCPIILNHEITRPGQDTTDSPVPLVGTFLLDREPPPPDAAPSDADTLSRYVVTLRVYRTVQRDGAFDFRDHLEQVADWADSLVVDVGPPAGEAGLGAWAGWASQVHGVLDQTPRMPDRLDLRPGHDDQRTAAVALPDQARQLPVFDAEQPAALVVTVRERPPDDRPGPRPTVAGAAR